MPIILRKTFSETYLERVRTTPHVIGFQYKATHAEAGPVGEWRQVTFRQYNDECRQISFGLMGLGVKHGDRVVILSNTRYEWSLCDLAILGASGVTVPIYASNTADDVAYILHHCEAAIAFLENDKQLEKILEKREQLPHLKQIILIEPAGMRLVPGRQDVMTLQALKELGRREENREPSRFERNLSEAQPGDAISICYTSGTTGVPKGAVITQDNMMSVLEDAYAVLPNHLKSERERLVSFLPFSHILGKVESMTPFPFGARAVYAENLDKLMANIEDAPPTILFAVPRIFEKAYARILAMVENGPKTKRDLFHWAFAVGKQYYAAIWDKRSPSLKLRLEFQAAKKLVLSKVAQRFGGQLQYAICGGAPLPREIGEFFQIVGIQILEGYGLTETCAPVTLMTPEDVRFGTVGRPMPEVQLKISPEDGEILVKSRKVFREYYKMPEETAQAIRNGWFHTGDIGHLDTDGFLHITDRKKDLIITSGGKNVAPQKIENLAKSQKFISQFVVHGDRRNYLTALVTLDQAQVTQYANSNQILFSEYAELVKHPKIQALVQKMIDEVNTQLASFETVKKFKILPRDFTVESGELTPSLKVKRGLINKRYQAELDAMYAS